MSESTIPKIAIVEDERLFQEILSAVLVDEGYEIVPFERGNDFLEAFEQTVFDLVLLDLGLPDEDGMVIARQLRTRSDVPIIVLTANIDESMRVACLSVGVDDFLSKNVAKAELKLRVKNLLWRSKRANGRDGHMPGTIAHRGWTFDLDNLRAENQDGSRADLTLHEFRTLKLLFGSKGRILSRGQILDGLSNGFNEIPSERMVDALVSRIRKKLDDQQFITTIKGLGYRLNLDA